MVFKPQAFLLCALPLLGWADNATTVGGPVSAYLYDSQARAIRPVIGYPGASYVGDAAIANLDAAGIAPDGAAALAVREGKLYLISGLKSGSPALEAIDGAISDVDRFAWSQDPSTVAVYASKSGQAQVLSNLTTSPTASPVLDFSGVRGVLSALAVDRSGAHVVAGFSADSGGGVYTASAGADPQFLAEAAKPVAILLANQEHDLYFADQERQQIWEVQSFDRQPASLLFADAGSGISAPVGIQFSRDGTSLFVAEAGSQTLDVFDLKARSATAKVALEFTPDTLNALSSRSMMLKSNVQGQEPYFVLNDAGADGLGVFFVPSGREQQ